MSGCHHGFSIDALHPVGFFYEDLDDQLPVLRCPVFVFFVVNDKLDVVLDISLLSVLVMKGNTVVRYAIENILDISLQSACDTYTQIREMQVDELLYEVQDFGAG